MIDKLGLNDSAGVKDPAFAGEAQRKVLRMVRNDRMGGSVPAWERAATPLQSVESTLSQAQASPDTFKAVLAYRQGADAAQTSTDSEFGFADLIDMVNPLQHIPVIGHVYRAVTGDEIKPIGRIVGGAAFGGAIGAAAGLINVIVEEETGKDVTGNAIALAFNGDMPSLQQRPSQNPQERLNEAVQIAQNSSHQTYQDLPGALLSFVDLKQGADIVVEKIKGDVNAYSIY